MVVCEMVLESFNSQGLFLKVSGRSNYFFSITFLNDFKNIEIAVRIHINIKNDILFVSDFFIFTQDVSAVATAFFSWYLQEIARD